MGNIYKLDFNDAQDQNDVDAPEHDVKNLEPKLLQRLPEALSHLFPHGKITGKQFKVGNIQGEPGDSLVFELEGEKAGVWFDFESEEKGNIWSAWAYVMRFEYPREFPKILDSVAQWLGETPRPAPPAVQKPSSVADLGHYTEKWDFHDRDWNVIACVYRFDLPDGRKEYRPWDVVAHKWGAPNPRPLYNLPRIIKADTVVLVEGEKCAQALIDQGIVATTAMFGANAPVDKTDWSPLQGKCVTIWPDKDKAGWEYAENVERYLLEQGIAASVSILRPPEDKPEKWDVADAVEEEMDIRAFLKTASYAKHDKTSFGIQLEDWKACERFVGDPPKRQWLVEGIFPMAQASLVASSGGAGKSFLFLQLAKELAAFNGLSFQAPMLFGGGLLTKGTAVYLTAEDDAIEVHNRLHALGPIPDSLYVVPLPDAGGAKPLFTLNPATRSAATTATWHSLVSQLSDISDLKLVAIDPLQPLCALDLNVPENAQFVCSCLATLAASTGASVIISHHFAKREASNPEQAREAIRGSGGLVDGVRSVYALWHPKQEQAEAICKALKEPCKRGGVIMGGVVKANGRANLRVTPFVRNAFGLLEDRSDDLSKVRRSDGHMIMRLKAAIAQAAEAGRPYTKTGANGVYERRFEFPEAFHCIGKHKLTTWVDQLLANGELVASMAEGSKVVKWLDVPTGPVARGEAVFVVGHVQRANGGRGISAGETDSD